MCFYYRTCLKPLMFLGIAASLLLSCAAPDPLGPRHTDRNNADGSPDSPDTGMPPDLNTNQAGKPNGTPSPTPPVVSTIENTDTLIALTVLGSDKDLYRTDVVPMMEKSCLHGGCHAAAIVIDLQEYPYKAEGSFVWEDIKRALGDPPDPEKAQKMLADSLLSSIQTAYMPQGFEAPIPTADQTDIYEQWIEEGMLIPDLKITGEIVVNGYVGEHITASKNFVVNDGKTDALLEFDKFKTADKILLQYLDAKGILKSTLNLEMNEFWQKTTVQMSMKSM